MRIFSRVALACLVTASVVLSAISADAADKSGKRRGTTFKHDYSAAYTVQRVSVRTACFPDKLEAILAHIRAKTGKKPMVTSGHRPRSGTSQHSRCYAADIRVPGVSEKAILAAAAGAPGIGGIGRYCNGIVHVDIGPKRRWAHCGGKSKGKGGLANLKRHHRKS
ncbi:D-Ala-D-Ala carboxypeptidase family metallohydrolase [Rhizobium panacihumi]|uniref:D-Ala-D-Ala carboxypeptidase family metallohydrolase n=1 Tax=Rhizobium panacihumi TaxID=2008450 RepID=UPI003D79267C